MNVARMLLLAMASLGAVAPLRPCTTFCLVDGSHVVFGRNFDYYVSDGRVMVNRRALAKTAYGTGSVLQWVSRYGSVTFNQFGHEFPNGGMNEAGLVVEMMMLDGSQHPDDARPGLTELQWIQYQLDRCATIDEVLASDRDLRIVPGSVPLHFLVADRSGRAAVIEFLGGRRVVYTGATLPVAALTNNTYESSLAYAGTTPPAAADHVSSLGRFVHAAASVRAFAQLPAADPIAYAFNALDNVNQPGSTQWTMVYDIGDASVYFRTRTVARVKHVRLDQLDFRPTAVVRMLDMNANLGGDVVPPDVYTRADNLAVLLSVFRQTPPLAGTPLAELERRASFPDSVIAMPAPRIMAHPQSQTLAPRHDARFEVTAASPLEMTYQWMRNGEPIAGATNASVALTAVTETVAGDYTAVVTSIAGATTSRVARLTVSEPEAGRLSNVSVRAPAGVGNEPLIVGFTMSGGSKRVLVRAVGPSLTSLFGVPGTLADPRVDVHQTVAAQDHVVGTNDNWGGSATECDALAATCAALGAFPLETTSADAALLLPADGERTVHTAGGPGAHGIVLVEVYDAGNGNAPRLVNVSTRNHMGAGDDVLIAGFVINGNVPKRLQVRGLGPALATLFGIGDVLADPWLELHTRVNGADTIVAVNDDWENEPGAGAAGTTVGAFPLPAGSRDAALVATVPAGSYSVVLHEALERSGNGMIEVYELP